MPWFPFPLKVRYWPELTPAGISISIGDNVKHDRFGIGVVIKIEGNGSNKKAVISFQKSGSKSLLLRFAKLKIIK